MALSFRRRPKPAPAPEEPAMPATAPPVLEAVPPEPEPMPPPQPTGTEWIAMRDAATAARAAVLPVVEHASPIPYGQMDAATAERAQASTTSACIGRYRLDLADSLLPGVHVAGGRFVLRVASPAYLDREDTRGNPATVWATGTESRWYLLDDAIELLTSPVGPAAEIRRRQREQLDANRADAERNRQALAEEAKREAARRKFLADQAEWLALPEVARAALSAARRFRSGTAGRASLVELARAAVTQRKAMPSDLDTELSGIVGELTHAYHANR